MLMQPSLAPTPLARSLPSVAAAPIGRRVLFFDNLRVVAIAMVILQHVGQAYGPTGGEWPIKETQTALILGPFFTVNRSFGMSLFFMIAGYFMVIACDRKGPAPFAKDRILRLGVPLLAWWLVMELGFGLVGPLLSGGAARFVWPVEMAHMWFVQHLLIFCLVYAAWRWLRRDHPVIGSTATRVPPWWAILAFALVLAVVSALVRTWYPIDDWVFLFGFIKVAWADVPRDLSLFVIGALAYRYGWLLGFPSRSGRIWLAVGVLLAALMYVFKLTVPGADELKGLGYAVWESLLCVSMCIGLTVAFRDVWNSQSALAKKMAQAQYGTYIFHLVVVIAFQWALLGLMAAPFVKFVLASLLAVPTAFLMGYWVRKPLRL